MAKNLKSNGASLTPSSALKMLLGPEAIFEHIESSYDHALMLFGKWKIKADTRLGSPKNPQDIQALIEEANTWHDLWEAHRIRVDRKIEKFLAEIGSVK